MFIAVSKLKDKSETKYCLCEEYTGTSVLCRAKHAKEIIKRVGVKNLKIINNKIVETAWGNGIPDYIFENTPWLRDEQYTLIRCNIHPVLGTDYILASTAGRVMECNKSHFELFVGIKSVVNHIVKADNTNEFVGAAVNVYTYEVMEKAKRLYNEHINKMRLLGYTGDFEYEIIDNKIIINRFINTGTKVVIPNFVYAIKSAAILDTAGSIDMYIGSGVEIIGDELIVNRNGNKVRAQAGKNLKYVGINNSGFDLIGGDKSIIYGDRIHLN